jgi:CelD/BcsL family acetyltransferase involved in cellulose biosynthesis
MSSLVVARTIRTAIDEGLQMFDMLWGAEPYKWLWACEARRLQQIHLFPGHLRGRVPHGAVAMRRTLGRLGRRMLTLPRHAHPAPVPVGEPGPGETFAT